MLFSRQLSVLTTEQDKYKIEDHVKNTEKKHDKDKENSDNIKRQFLHQKLLFLPLSVSVSFFLSVTGAVTVT